MTLNPTFIYQLILAGAVLALIFAAFSIFFDQAVLTRGGTLYRLKTNRKKIALTFDDGPSPVWTPLILDELKKANVKATFFMIGYHVKKYPEVARRVAAEGHTIGNHGYAHTVILYYTLAEVEEEIKYTEMVIKEITGETTQYYRPPKAWMTKDIKEKIKSMGYEVILWSLNSKDWVMFNYQYIVGRLLKKIRSGDIVLFHDSGSVVSAEGGDRSQTVLAVVLLIKELRAQGYEFVSIDEILKEGEVIPLTHTFKS